MNEIELGKFINKLRLEAGLTQDELAEKVGVSSGKIVSKWENGYNLPDFITMKKISIALNVTLYELSECKRFKKKRLIDKTKDYIKSSKDIFKLNIIGKVTIVIAILLGIFFGLTSIYTINNYGTVEIYTMESLDEDFVIKGNIIITKEYSIFDLIELYSVKDDKFLDSNALNIEYIVNKENNRIIRYSNKDNLNNSNKIINNIKSTHFSIQIVNDIVQESNFTNNDILNLQILYENDENKFNIIEFPFRIIKKYQNIF